MGLLKGGSTLTLASVFLPSTYPCWPTAYDEWNTILQYMDYVTCVTPIPPHHAFRDLAINGIFKALNDLQLEVVDIKTRANRPPRDRSNVVCHGCN